MCFTTFCEDNNKVMFLTFDYFYSFISNSNLYKKKRRKDTKTKTKMEVQKKEKGVDLQLPNPASNRMKPFVPTRIPGQSMIPCSTLNDCKELSSAGKDIATTKNIDVNKETNKHQEDSEVVSKMRSENRLPDQPLPDQPLPDQSLPDQPLPDQPLHLTENEKSRLKVPPSSPRSRLRERLRANQKGRKTFAVQSKKPAEKKQIRNTNKNKNKDKMEEVAATEEKIGLKEKDVTNEHGGGLEEDEDRDSNEKRSIRDIALKVSKLIKKHKSNAVQNLLCKHMLNMETKELEELSNEIQKNIANPQQKKAMEQMVKQCYTQETMKKMFSSVKMKTPLPNTLDSVTASSSISHNSTLA
jgi:hypothetical protein